MCGTVTVVTLSKEFLYVSRTRVMQSHDKSCTIILSEM